MSLDDLQDIVFERKVFSLSSEEREAVAENHKFLVEFSKNRLIYGINTGFGPMAQYRIGDDDLKQLQYNLIRSHSTGTGKVLPPLYTRAAMLCRLLSLSRGYSGVHPSTVLVLEDFLRHEIYPVIYEHGSVGASGDLVQLAHLALALIGEGEVSYRGEIRPTQEVLQALQIEPLKVHLREGLALINGTSVMSGIALVNLRYAQRLLDWAIMASAMVNEVVNSCDDHYSTELNAKKLHPGQQAVAQQMSEILKESLLIRRRKENYYDKQPQGEVLVDKVQEYYSLRCVPQILGPIYDAVQQARQVVENEVHSANDNPMIDHHKHSVYHGGNFHGDYISLEMDKLKIATVRLSMLMERQLNYLLNAKLNEKFPPFLNLGKLGLNLGMQAMQFTATSTTAENQTLAFPNYVHSIPNNQDNQDIVSMGTNTALFTRQVIDNSYEVMAIHLIAIIQAYEFVDSPQKMAPPTAKAYALLREIVPVFIEDTPKYQEIARMKDFIMNHDIYRSL